MGARSLSLGAVVLSVALAAASTCDARQRTFVKSNGVDPAPCDFSNPCRTFSAAIAQTDPSGEVVILDTAGYGPMVINKAIKIIGPAGVYGGISVQGGANPTTGIVINASNSDDITLRGLDITSVPGAPPLPLIGIDIQNAGGVHIEKTSITGFSEDAGSCIQLNTTGTVRVYVDDSLLRACRNGILADGNTVHPNSSSVIVDNTRIERHRGPTVSYGIWIRNHMTVDLRNSVISRANVAIRGDVTLDGSGTAINVVNSQLPRVDQAIVVNKIANNAPTQISVTGTKIGSVLDGIVFANSGASSTTYLSLMKSEIVNGTTLMNVSNSAAGSSVFVRVADSHIGVSTNGIQLSNTTSDANTRVYLDFVRSELYNVTNPMIDASATNGGKMNVHVEGSTFANSSTVFKVGGASPIGVSIVRSHVHNCTTVLDYVNPAALVRLDGNHFASCINDFVNNGGTAMMTFGNNAIDIPNSGGLSYIPLPPPTALK
jgi:hypothetical protein